MDDFLFPGKQLRNSWLVQRLEKPIKMKGALAAVVNAFSFGGGLKDGGISKEGMGLLREILSFDYMGSAEFEWGIVPSTLHFIVSNRKDMVTGEATVRKAGPPVYYICHKLHEPQLEARLKEFASKNPPPAKERVCLNGHFSEKDDKWPTRAVGWLDCSNGLMFFVDKEMYEQVCQLFGLGTQNEQLKENSNSKPQAK